MYYYGGGYNGGNTGCGCQTYSYPMCGGYGYGG